MDVKPHNEFVSDQIRRFGRELDKRGTYGEKMVALENITAAMIAMVAITHNKQPEALYDNFIVGLKEALDKAIYGRKQ